MRWRTSFFVFLWLTLVSVSTRAQLLQPAGTDSLRQAAKISKPDSNRSKLWLRLGEQYYSRASLTSANVDSAAKFVTQALFLSLTLNDRIAEAKCLARLQMIYARQDNLSQFQPLGHPFFPFADQIKDPFQQANLWYQAGSTYSDVTPEGLIALERALDLFQRLGNQEQVALVTRDLANLHQRQGKYAQALGELMQALKIQNTLNSRTRHTTYDLLSHVYFRLGIYEQALPYALASVKSARATADTASLYLFYYRIGLIYSELGQSKQSLAYFTQLVSKLKRENGSTSFLIACVNQVNKALLSENKPREALAYHRQILRDYPLTTVAEKGISAYGLALIYLKLDSTAQAENSLLQVSKLATLQDRDAHTFALMADLKLCQHYAEKKQYAKSRYHLNQSFLLADLSPKLRSQVHLQAFMLDSLQGNLASAIGHYQQYQAINDSLFNEKKSNQLLGFQVRYETQQKEQVLKLKEKNIALLTQQSQIQQARLSQRQTLRNALLAGVAMLVLLLILGYNRYRLKQRSNQQLKARQAEIDRKNTDLQTLVLEKEWLLKEIHHRVKNNLQVVMSLLNSQASHLSNDTALAAIRESQHRVQAMALIHQKLYQSEQVARIAMPTYLNELVTYLRDSYSQPVTFELAVEPIEVDVTVAVPLGLITNEAITNALKYAFPHKRPGRIGLSLQRLEPATYQLIIEDDGVGLPADFAPGRNRSLGMTLIHGFSRQLGGKLTFNSKHGLTIKLVFGEPELNSALNSVDYAYQ